MKRAALLGAVILLVGAWPTRGDDPPPASAPDPHAPPRLLSAWNLFEAPAKSQRPGAGVVPYSVNASLFTDYAHKRRFLRLPEGKRASYRAEDPLAFPVGTVLVKTFSFFHDARDPSAGERLIETRLLVHGPKGWVGLPYVWNAEQTEATLKVAGAIRPVGWIDVDGEPRDLRYLVPNSNQCKGCHERGGVMGPVGPTARNLSDVDRWPELGLLSGLPEPDSRAPALPAWDDPTATLEARARAYLEVNCAHCHDPKGPGNTAGLDLRVSQTDLTKLGLNKPPVAAGRGAGGLQFDIVAGDPDRSILVHRMSSTDPGVLMPELGRGLVHREGVELIRAWIRSLGPND